MGRCNRVRAAVDDGGCVRLLLSAYPGGIIYYSVQNIVRLVSRLFATYKIIHRPINCRLIRYQNRRQRVKKKTAENTRRISSGQVSRLKDIWTLFFRRYLAHLSSAAFRRFFVFFSSSKMYFDKMPEKPSPGLRSFCERVRARSV